MAENAFVCWCEFHGAPWLVEGDLIRTVDLPLNLDRDRHYTFTRS
jgi:hypothetical protein